MCHDLGEGLRCAYAKCFASRGYADPQLFTKPEWADIAFDAARRAQAFRQATPTDGP